jgi:glycosyltransferase involved in cell wall biosynthesis
LDDTHPPHATDQPAVEQPAPTASLDDLTVLIDCRWLGMTGIGTATELLLHSLAEAPPPGRWLLLASSSTLDLAWDGASVLECSGDPRQLLGQRRLAQLPHRDVAIFPGQIRPLTRGPVVQYLHDVIPVVTEQRAIPRALKRAYLKAIARNSTRLLVNSAAAGEAIHRALGVDRQKMRELVYPVDPAMVARVRALREELGQEEQLLCVGRASPHKNHDRLVEAFKRSAWSSRGRLVLAGPGTEAGPTAAGVERLGQVSPDHLERLYATSRAVALPSLVEGLGLPVIEAHAVGLPVLTSNRPPMRELTLPGDLTFDPESLDQMAGAIDALLSSPSPLLASPPMATLADLRAIVLDEVIRAVRARTS